MLDRRGWVNWKWSLYFFLGSLMGYSREKLGESYIRESNEAVLRGKYALKGEEILLLVPHCLQRDSCPHKITRHLENCRQCGGCKIGALKSLQEKYGCRLDVATGGTLARQIIRQYRPRGIVAVACHRDLVSGIRDVYPLPVLGVLNQRPFGPCFNTDVDLESIETALRFFMGDGHG